MNRTHDKHFFSTWDKAKEITSYLPRSPKDHVEAQEALDAFIEEYGFEPTLAYPDFIEEYKQAGYSYHYKDVHIN